MDGNRMMDAFDEGLPSEPPSGHSSWWYSLLRRPGERWTHLMLRLVLTQTSHYYQLLKLCLGNTNNIHQLEGDDEEARVCSSPRSPPAGGGTGNKLLAKVLSWGLMVSLHDRFMLAFYSYILVKYRLIWMLSLLDDYRYLDCFIVGRFKFIGRTDRCSGQIVTGFVILFGIYRIGCIYLDPKFKFYTVEFLLNNFEDVQTNCREPVLVRSYSSPLAPAEGAVGFTDASRFARHSDSRAGPTGRPAKWRAPRRHRSTPSFGSEPASQPIVDSIFYLRSPFEPDRAEWILRPNRTADSWLLLSLCTRILFAIALVSYLSWNMIIWYMIGGSTVTDLGFEMSYSTCVAWLESEQPANANTSDGAAATTWASLRASVYMPPKLVAAEMKIDDLPARIPISFDSTQKATPYNMIRMLADILENQLVYTEFNFAFMSSLYLLTIQSIDVIINGKQINNGHDRSRQDERRRRLWPWQWPRPPPAVASTCR